MAGGDGHVAAIAFDDLGCDRADQSEALTPTLADALSQAEEQVKSLSADVQSMAAARDHAFTPPPRAWIHDRIGKLNHLLATRTESPPSRSGG